MDLSTFFVAVTCLVDDWLEGGSTLRQRGPEPTLGNSEVLTREIVDEFLGMILRRASTTTSGATMGSGSLPKGTHRTTFTRQMANLWVVKERLWRELLRRVSFDPSISLVDSSRCRLAGLPGPTAAESWPKNRPLATTK